jgi:molecular chaperone DnaK (HSP70)
MESQSENWIGIDLGTYNSSAAICSKEGNIEIIKSRNQNYTCENSPVSSLERYKEFPSFISFTKEGLITDIGLNSKEKSYCDPEFVVWGMKRLLGKSYTELKNSGELDRLPYRIKPDQNNGQCLIVVGEKTYSPVQLCAEILKKIKSDAESQINCIVNSAIISVPAYFDPTRITPIIDAAKLAGFNKVKTIPEPVAASLAYSIDITVKPVKTLVVDLGAGTLDITAGYLFRHPDRAGDFRFQVMKTTGDAKLGGTDFDDRVLNFILKKCEIRQISKTELSVIRRIAEISKIRLSEEFIIDQDFQLNGNIYRFSMNQSDLKTLLEGSGTEKNFLEECRTQIMAAISEISWSTQEIEQLIIIGGPTKLPCIREVFNIVFYSNTVILNQLNEFYSGKEKVDRMTAVSIGAALSIYRKAIDLAPHGHGFEDLEFTDEQLVYKPNIIVPRDTPYPFTSKQVLINWVNYTGLYEFKILQHIPASEIEHCGFEYRFIGIIKFAVRDPFFTMQLIQMGYNSNKELIINIENALCPSESATYVGINNYACFGIHYPLSVKRPPYINANKTKKNQPSPETLEKFIKWTQIISGYIQKKVDDFPIHQMLVQQILDEVNLFFKKPELKSQFESLFTKINTLLWNSSSSGLLTQSEFSELNNRLRDFEVDLFELRKG